jgi:fatty acid desaturase
LTLAASRVGVVGSVVAAALIFSTIFMPSAVAALNIGVGPCWGVTCGYMLEAMARITPLQPNDAMARIASRRNRTISLDPGKITKRFFGHKSELLSKV